MSVTKLFLALSALVLLTAPRAQAAKLGVPAQYGSIHDAIAAAGDGDTIVIDEGVYPEPMNISFRTNLTVKGKGKVVIDAGGAANALYVGFSSGITFKRITFRDTTGTQALVDTCSDVRFKDCRFRQSGGIGIDFWAGDGHEVIDCDFKDIAGTGLRLQTRNAHVERARMVDVGQGPNEACIRILHEYATVDRCVILDDGVGPGIAIGPNGEATTFALVIDNEVRGAHDGIVLEDAMDCLVEGNRVRDCVDDSLDIAGAAQNNTLIDNVLVKAGGTGVELSGDDNAFVGNQVRKAAGHGFQIMAFASQTYAAKNKVTKCGADGFHVVGSDGVFLQNVAKKNAGFDLADSAAPGVNEYVGNSFGSILP